MKRAWHQLSVFAVCLLVFTTVSAEESPSGVEENPTGFWSIQFENDGLAGTNDGEYTHGLKLDYVSKKPVPEWLQRLSRMTPFYEPGELSNVTYTLSQELFTPSDITIPTVIPGDRPYAGWLHVDISAFTQAIISPDYYHVSMVGISVGMVGPSAGGEAMQRFLHTLVNVHQPQGWSNQLSDEAALGLNYVHKWRLFEPEHKGYEFEVSPHAVVAVGNVYTYVGGGVMFRWGHGLRRDIGPPAIQPGFAGSTYFAPDPKPNWYLYAGHETRLMIRNIFLDGNTLVGSQRVEKEPVVGDLQFGIVFHLNRMRVAFSELIRTHEFTTQPRDAPYGAINLAFYF